VPLPETPQAQVESLGEGGIYFGSRETSVVEIIQTRYESSDTYQTLVGNNLLRDVAIDSRQVRVLRFGNETDMPVFQYIDPAVKDEMYRIYRDYNHGELGEIIHYGVFEPIGRAIENLRWQSDYWLWNDGEGSHANFTFVNSLDHFWHFQGHVDANHDQLTPEECDGEKEVCFSSSNTFAEELAQADHFEVERDILLTQLIGLSEPLMEEIEEAA
jgi:hypothetical protein